MDNILKRINELTNEINKLNKEKKEIEKTISHIIIDEVKIQKRLDELSIEFGTLLQKLTKSNHIDDIIKEKKNDVIFASTITILLIIAITALITTLISLPTLISILVSFGSGLLGIYPTVKFVKVYKQEKNEIINDCNKENIEQKIKEKDEEINFCHTKLIEERNLKEKLNNDLDNIINQMKKLISKKTHLQTERYNIINKYIESNETICNMLNDEYEKGIQKTKKINFKKIDIKYSNEGK